MRPAIFPSVMKNTRFVQVEPGAAFGAGSFPV